MLITPRELDRLSASNFIATKPDDYIGGVIESVSAKVAAFCYDTLFYPTDVVDEEVKPYPDGGTIVFSLSKGPLIDFSGAEFRWAYPTSPVSYPLDISQLRYVSLGRKVYIPIVGPNPQTVPPSDYFTGRLFAAYRAGYETVPLTVKRATALLCKEQILAEAALSDPANSHRIMAASPLQSFRAGYYSETYQSVSSAAKTVDILGSGTSLSVEATRLLNPYRGARLVIT